MAKQVNIYVPQGEFTIMAVDPGGTTGLAWSPSTILKNWDPNIIQNKEITGTDIEQVTEILVQMLEVRTRILIVEAFTPYPGRVLSRGRNQSKDAPGPMAPVKIDAMLRFALEYKWWDGQYVSQTASAAKTTVTDSRLKSAKLWIPGKDHARDAIRHLVYYIRGHRQK